MGKATQVLKELKEKVSSAKTKEKVQKKAGEKRKKTAKKAAETRKTKELQKANDNMKTSYNLRWFLGGGGVMLTGWILGFWMGRMRRRRTSDRYRL